jgi:DNA-binding response OmpR family regulator
MAAPDRVYRREELETAVWGERHETSDTLRSHMHTLRHALLQAGGRDPIETVHGIGYRLRLDP